MSSIQVTISGVDTVLIHFHELIEVFTQQKTRCDFFDALEQPGDQFYLDYTFFHISLDKFDEYLWFQLEQTVGGIVETTQIDENVQSVRPLSVLNVSRTSDKQKNPQTLALMNKFEAVSTRDDEVVQERNVQQGDVEQKAINTTPYSGETSAKRKLHENSTWSGIQK